MKRENLTIGISTKNRWESIQIVLDNLLQFGLFKIPVCIVDDGSDTPFQLEERFNALNIEIIRHEISKGYIVRRNELLAHCKTDYLLSLDDDSFPVLGTVEGLIKFADSLPNLFAICLPIRNVLGGMQVQSSFQEPYQCRSYVGCAHLLRVKTFLALGSYREDFIHQGEENDICYRALLGGFKVYHFPDLVIKHLYTPSSRNMGRMHYYGSRNKVIWNRLYLPPAKRYSANFRALVERCIAAFTTRSHLHLTGFWAGIVYKIQIEDRSLVNGKILKQWENLPFY